MSELLLLLGGARSGKSALAVQIASASETSVIFIATAEALDDDMRVRIERHRAERPKWTTIEEPFDLAQALAECPPSTLVIIDCLTLWTSNLMLRGDSESVISSHSTSALAAIAKRSAQTIVISNEVGLGIVPENQMARAYRDVIGQTNQQWARAATKTLFMVAGKAFELKEPQEILQ